MELVYFSTGKSISMGNNGNKAENIFELKFNGETNSLGRSSLYHGRA